MGFKVGDEVIYLGGSNDANMYVPSKNSEVVTVVDIVSPFGRTEYVLGGYEIDPKDGLNQCFIGESLRKVEPKKKSNSVTKELLQKFKETERELVEYVPEEIKTPITSKLCK